MVERKLFFQIRSINIASPNVENMIVVPITKRIKIVMSIQVSLISRMDFDYEENGAKKALLANPKHPYCVPYYGEHDCNAKNKRMEIVMGIQVCLIPWMNFDYKKNGGKKGFLANLK